MTADLRTALEAAMNEIVESYGVVLPDQAEVFDKVREVLAAHPPTTQPNRDDIADLILSFIQEDDEGDILIQAGPAADAILALLPGRPEHEIKAEALTEAANDAEPLIPDDDAGMFDRTEDLFLPAPDWLRKRAAQLQNGTLP